MAQLIQEFFAIIGIDMVCPTNLAEFFPWLLTILCAMMFFYVFIGLLKGIVSSFARSAR